MSDEIERRVLSMEFDNAKFEKNVRQTIDSLDNLDKALDMEDSIEDLKKLEQVGAHFSLKNISDNVEKIADRFTFLGNLAFKVKDRIADAFMDVAHSVSRSVSSMVSTLSTMDQMMAGLSKYELKTSSVQAIKSALPDTDLSEITAALEDLNKYTDETSYSFVDMVNTIGKFTANGVKLQDAVEAMKGIGNEAAKSGVGIQGANRAMYNFAQALATGKVRLMDWRSIENANMATKEFKEQIIETAVELGVLKRQGDKVTTKKGTVVDFAKFSETLNEDWFTSDVLIKVLGKYADTTTEFGLEAFHAAQQAKTLTEALDAVKDAASTGWMKTWELIFGNLDEAIELFTGLANRLIEIVDGISSWRNEILQGWRDLGGREELIQGLTDIFESLWNIIRAIGSGISDIFPPITAETIKSITDGVRNLGKSMRETFGINDKVTKSIVKRTTLIGASLEELDRQIRSGISGDDVKRLQERLQSLGYDIGTAGVDGIYGPKTEAALKSFQKDYGLAIDGIYGKLSHEKMSEVVGGGDVKEDLEIATNSVEVYSESLTKIQRITAGAASIVRIFSKAFSFLWNVVKAVGAALAPVADLFLSAFASLGDFFTSINNNLDSLGTFDTWLQLIKERLKPLTEWLTRACGAIKAFFGFSDAEEEATSETKTFFSIWNDISNKVRSSAIWQKMSGIISTIGEAIRGFVSSIPEKWENTKKFFAGLPAMWQNLTNKVKASPAWDKLSASIGKIRSAFSKLGESVKKAYDTVKTYILDKFGSNAFPAAGTIIETVIDKIGNAIVFVLDLVGPIIDKLPIAIEWISKFVESLGPGVSGFIGKIPSYWGSIKDFFGKIFSGVEFPKTWSDIPKSIGTFFSNIFNSTVEFFQNIEIPEWVLNTVNRIGEFFSQLFGSIASIFGFGEAQEGGKRKGIAKHTKAIAKQSKQKGNTTDIFAWISDRWNDIKKFISGTLEDIITFIEKHNLIDRFVGILSNLNLTLLFSAILNVSKAFRDITQMGKIFAQTKLQDAKAKKWKAIAQTFAMFALVVGVIAASIYVLGKMKPDELTRGAGVVGGIIVLLVALTTLSALFINGKAIGALKAVGEELKGLAAAIGVMALAIFFLGKFVGTDTFLSGLWKLGVILASIVAFSKLTKGSKADFAGMKELAVVIAILAGIVFILGKFMSPEQLIRGGAAIAGILIMLGIFMKKMSAIQFDEKALSGIKSIAGAVAILAVIGIVLGLTPVGALKKGGIALGAIMVALGALIWFIGKSKVDKGAGIALIGLATVFASVVLFAQAMAGLSTGGFVKAMIGMIVVVLAIKMLTKTLSTLSLTGSIKALLGVLPFISVMITFGAFALMMNHVSWGGFVKAILGLFAVVVAIKLLNKTLGQLSILGSVKALIAMVPLILAMASFAASLRLIKDVDPSVIVSFAAGISAIFLAFGGFLALSASAGWAGLGVGLLAIVGLIAIIGLVIAAFSELSQVKGFQEFMNRGASSIGEVIGSFLGSMKAAEIKAFSQGVASFNQLEVPDPKAVEIATQCAEIFQKFNDALPDKSIPERIIDWIIGSKMSQFAKDMTSFSEGFNAFAGELMKITIENAEALTAKTEAAVACGRAFSAFETSLPEKEVLDRLADKIFGSKIEYFATDMGTFAKGFNSLAMEMSEITVVDSAELVAKTTSAVAIAQMINTFGESLDKKPITEQIIDSILKIKSPMETFADSEVAFAKGFNKYSEVVSAVDLNEEALSELESKTEYMVAISNSVAQFAGGLDAFKDNNSIVDDWVDHSPLGHFIGDLKNYAIGFSSYSILVENVVPNLDALKELDKKTTFMVQISNSVAEFASGLNGFEDNNLVVDDWVQKSPLGHFIGDLTNYATGFGVYAALVKETGLDLDALKELDQKTTFMVQISNSVAKFASGLDAFEGNSTDVDLWIAYSPLSHFVGDLTNYATGFGVYAALVKETGLDLDALKELDQKTTFMVQISNSVAKFASGLDSFENDNDTVSKWVDHSPLGHFVGDLKNYATGFGVYAALVKETGLDLDALKELDQKTTFMVKISNSVAKFAEGLNSFENNNLTVDWWVEFSPLSHFVGDLKNYATGFGVYAALVKETGLDLDALTELDNKTKFMIQISNSVAQFSEGLNSFSDNNLTVAEWVDRSPLGHFIGDLKNYATGFYVYAGLVRETSLDEEALKELDQKTKFMIQISNSVAQFATGLDPFEDNSKTVQEWIDYSPLSHFIGDMSQFALGFNDYAKFVNQIKMNAMAWIGLGLKTKYMIAIAGSVADFATGLKPFENPDVTVNEWITTSPMAHFKGDLSLFATAMNTFAQTMANTTFEKGIEDKLDTALGISSKVATFLVDLDALKIEQNRGAVGKFFLGENTHETVFDSVKELGTSIAGLVNDFAQFKDMQIVTQVANGISIMRRFASFLVWISSQGGEDNPNAIRLDIVDSYLLEIDKLKGTASSISAFASTLSSVGVDELDSYIGMVKTISSLLDWLSGNQDDSKKVDTAQISAWISGFDQLFSLGDKISQFYQAVQNSNADQVHKFAESILFIAQALSLAAGVLPSGNEVYQYLQRAIDYFTVFSGLFVGVGEKVDIEIAQGMTDNVDVVSAAADLVVSTLKTALETAIAEALTITSDELDSALTITPVLDVSDVEAGARKIGGLLGQRHTIQATGSAAMARETIGSAEDKKSGAKVFNTDIANNSSVNVTGNTFVIRKEEDIDVLANRIATLLKKQNRSYGVPVAFGP